jgi:hypothetical protein
MSNKQEEKLFRIPDSFFEKLYEFTGSGEDLRGFVLAYISSDNTPTVKSIFRNATIQTALLKTITDYVKSQKTSIQDVGDGEDEGGEEDLIG